jgi:3-hydroxyisobutyrate dehydrogenase
MTKVAFLGLGAMGSRMAKNILATGFDLAVWNRSEAAAKTLEAQGAISAKSPKEAAEGADVVVAMLTDDKASESVWTSALTGMKKGAVAVEMSTLTPAWVAELAQRAEAAGVKLLDAPVSGSRPQAEAKALVIMTGGDAAAYEAAKPVLAAMGAPHHVGPTGTGAVYKLAVNALLGIQIAAWAELIAFFEQNGVNPADAVALIATMPVSSASGGGMAKLMIANDHAPRFTNALLAKDFRYLQQTAATTSGKTPVSDVAAAIFASGAEKWGEENVTAVVKLYESK